MDITFTSVLTEIHNIKKCGMIKSNKPNMFSKWNKSIKYSKVLSSKESSVPSFQKNQDFPIKSTLNLIKSTKLSMDPSELQSIQLNSIKLPLYPHKLKISVKPLILQESTFLLQEKVIYNLSIWLSIKIPWWLKGSQLQLINQGFFNNLKKAKIKIIFFQ